MDVRRLRFELMAAEHVKRLGERLRTRREELDLTQEEVARAMPGRVTGARISLWERGQNRPRDEALAQLAEVLETTAAALLSDPPDKSMTPDVFAAGPNVDAPAEDRLVELERAQERIESKLDEVLLLLASMRDAGRTPEVARAISVAEEIAQRHERQDQAEPAGRPGQARRDRAS